VKSAILNVKKTVLPPSAAENCWLDRFRVIRFKRPLATTLGIWMPGAKNAKKIPKRKNHKTGHNGMQRF